MELTPGVVAQGDGGVPDVTPASGTAVPVVFFKKQRLVASTNVKPTQCTSVELVQMPQQAAALVAGVGGAAIVPMLLIPGISVHDAPGLPTAPEITAESGVIASSLFFKLWQNEGVSR